MTALTTMTTATVKARIERCNKCVRDSFSKDITSYVETIEVQKVLKRIVRSFGSGAVVWVHDDCPDVTRGGLPKAVAKPVKDYFVNHHERARKSRKDLFAANSRVKELETELKNEREKNQAERNRLRRRAQEDRGGTQACERHGEHVRQSQRGA